MKMTVKEQAYVRPQWQYTITYLTAALNPYVIMQAMVSVLVLHTFG